VAQVAQVVVVQVRVTQQLLTEQQAQLIQVVVAVAVASTQVGKAQQKVVLAVAV